MEPKDRGPIGKDLFESMEWYANGDPERLADIDRLRKLLAEPETDPGPEGNDK